MLQGGKNTCGIWYLAFQKDSQPRQDDRMDPVLVQTNRGCDDLLGDVINEIVFHMPSCLFGRAEMWNGMAWHGMVCVLESTIGHANSTYWE